MFRNPRRTPALAGSQPAPSARRVRRVITQPGVHAFEAAYAPGARLPEHGHAAPFFTYVLRGGYVERAGHRERVCARGTVIFHDHESHTNHVWGRGTASLNVELDPDLWRELAGSGRAFADLAGRVLGGDIEWQALGVWREFHLAEPSAVLGLEEATV